MTELLTSDVEIMLAQVIILFYCHGVLPLQRALSPQTSHALIKLFYKAHSRKRSAETSEAQLFGRQTYQRVLP